MQRGLEELSWKVTGYSVGPWVIFFQKKVKVIKLWRRNIQNHFEHRQGYASE